MEIRTILKQYDGNEWYPVYIKTSADMVELSNGKTVEEEMGNKLDKYTKMQNPPQSWDELWSLEPGVYSWVQSEPIPEWQPNDTPYGLLRAELTIHSSGQSGGSHSFMLSYIDGAVKLKRYFGELKNDGTGSIAAIVTATPPQVYNLSLISGYAGKATYMKTQEGIVFVQIQNVYKTDGTNLPGDGQFATLPEEFRPVDRLDVNGTLSDGSYKTGICGIVVYPSGVIKIAGMQLTIQNSKYITGSFFFVAA